MACQGKKTVSSLSMWEDGWILNIVILFLLLENILTKNNLGQTEFILAHNSKFQTIAVTNQGRSLKQLVTSHPQARAKRNRRVHA